MRRQAVLKYFEEYKDYMENRVAEGIEKYRKGDITLYSGSKRPPCNGRRCQG